MKFLVDAQLPSRLADWLTAAGHDAIHTSQLKSGNRSTDSEVYALADSEQRVLVTKDSDFVNEHLLHNRPAKLLLITTGNVSNRSLEQIFARFMPDILAALSSSNFVEVGSQRVMPRG
jgi:predicted nuclease of predicted toxin-antitoxin system